MHCNERGRCSSSVNLARFFLVRRAVMPTERSIAHQTRMVAVRRGDCSEDMYCTV